MYLVFKNKLFWVITKSWVSENKFGTDFIFLGVRYSYRTIICSVRLENRTARDVTSKNNY